MKTPCTVTRLPTGSWLVRHSSPSLGKTPQELCPSKTIPDAMTLGWLELFEKKAKAMSK